MILCSEFQSNLRVEHIMCVWCHQKNRFAIPCPLSIYASKKCENSLCRCVKQVTPWQILDWGSGTQVPHLIGPRQYLGMFAQIVQAVTSTIDVVTQIGHYIILYYVTWTYAAKYACTVLLICKSSVECLSTHQSKESFFFITAGIPLRNSLRSSKWGGDWMGSCVGTREESHASWLADSLPLFYLVKTPQFNFKRKRSDKLKETQEGRFIKSETWIKEIFHGMKILYWCTSIMRQLFISEDAYKMKHQWVMHEALQFANRLAAK